MTASLPWVQLPHFSHPAIQYSMYVEQEKKVSASTTSIPFPTWISQQTQKGMKTLAPFLLRPCTTFASYKLPGEAGFNLVLCPNAGCKTKSDRESKPGTFDSARLSASQTMTRSCRLYAFGYKSLLVMDIKRGLHIYHFIRGHLNNFKFVGIFWLDNFFMYILGPLWRRCRWRTN